MPYEGKAGSIGHVMLFCHLFERVIVTGRDEEAGKNMTTPGLGNANKTCFSMTPSMRNANNMTNKYQKYINIYTVYINIYTVYIYIYYIHTYKNDSRGKLKFFWIQVVSRSPEETTQ